MRVRSTLAFLCLLSLLVAPTTLARPADSGTISLDYVADVVSGIVDSLVEGVAVLFSSSDASDEGTPDFGPTHDPFGSNAASTAEDGGDDDDGGDGAPEFGAGMDPFG